MADRFQIVNFHGIGTPKRPLEPGEDRYWISTDQYAGFLDQIAAAGERVLITFDDGNLSDLEIGAKGLEARGLTATFFPLAGRLEDTGSLGPDDLLELLHLGHKVGSHGHDHVSWRQMDDATAQRELAEAKSLLESHIGRKIGEAAIPFGQYGRSTLQRLKAAGFSRAYSSDGGSFTGMPFPIPRWSVRADTSQQDLAGFLAGDEPFVRTVRRALAKTKKQLF